MLTFGFTWDTNPVFLSHSLMFDRSKQPSLLPMKTPLTPSLHITAPTKGRNINKCKYGFNELLAQKTYKAGFLVRMSGHFIKQWSISHVENDGVTRR